MSNIYISVDPSNWNWFRVRSDPLEINKTFMEFYKFLYSSDCSHVTADLVSFFDKINIPTLDQNVTEELESPITAIKLEVAVKSLQSGKSQGHSFIKHFGTSWPRTC